MIWSARNRRKRKRGEVEVPSTGLVVLDAIGFKSSCG